MRLDKLIYIFFLAVLSLTMMSPICEGKSTNPEQIAKDLEAKDPQIQFRALWTLTYPAAKSLPEAQKAKLSKLVIEKTSSSPKKVKYAAIRALIQLDPSALPRLAPKLLNDSDPTIRAEILFALLHTRQYPKKTVIPQLKRALIHKNKTLRNAAIRFVEKIPSEQLKLVDALIKNYILHGLSDSRSRTVIIQLHSLARPAILKAFAEANKLEKIAVADLAAQIPILDVKPFLDPLARGLKSEDPRLVRRITGAVGRLGQSARSLTPLVLYVLQSAKHTDQKMLALTALSKISSDDKAIIEVIGSFLEDRSLGVQRSALNALSRYHQDAQFVIDKIIPIALRPTSSRDSVPRVAKNLLKKIAPYSSDGLAIILKKIDSGSPSEQGRLRALLPSFKGRKSLAVYIEQFPALQSRGRQACLISIAKHDQICDPKLKSVLLLAIKDPLPQVVEDALFLCARYPFVDEELKRAVLTLQDRGRDEIQLAKKLCQSAWTNDPNIVVQDLMKRMSKPMSIPDRYYNARVIEEMSKCRLYTTSFLKACQRTDDVEVRISFCQMVRENTLDDKWIITALIEFLALPEKDLRNKALEALGEVADDKGCDAIIKHLLNNADDEATRTVAIQSLSVIGRNALRQLRAYILSNNEKKEMWVLYQALVAVADAAIPCDGVILRGLISPHAEIRMNSLDLLYKERNITDEIVQFLLAILKDPSDSRHYKIFYILAERERWDSQLLELAFDFVKASMEKEKPSRYYNAYRYLYRYPLNAKHKARGLELFRLGVNHQNSVVRLYSIFGVALCTDDWTPCLNEFAAILNSSVSIHERQRIVLLLTTVDKTNDKLNMALEQRIRNDSSKQVIIQVVRALAIRNMQDSILKLFRRRYQDVFGTIYDVLDVCRFSNSKKGIQLFKSTAPELRELYCAIVALFEAPSPECRDRLYLALSDEENSVRAYALEVMSKIKPQPRDLLRIYELTRSKDTDILDAAYHALKRAPPSPESLACLIDGLKHPLYAVRLAAIKSIPNQLVKADEQVFQTLVQLFKQERRANIRNRYVNCLRLSCPTKESLAQVIEAAFRDPSNRNSLFLGHIRELIRLGYPFKNIGKLTEPFLKGEREVFRSHALLTYGFLGAKAKPFLNSIKALKKDSAIEVRFTAKVVSALIEGDRSRALEHTRKGLSAKNDLVRLRAVVCLGMIPKLESRDVDSLIKLMDDPWWNVRCLAIEELGFLGSQAIKAADIIKKKYWKFGEYCRAEAELTLGKIRGDH